MEEDKLKGLARVYPSAVVLYEDGTQTTISLEWYEQNSQSVALKGFALIYIYKDGTKEEVEFDSYEQMIEELQKIYNFLN
jgi:hypothetical protein